MVRQGVTEAFDVLYERHLKIAQYVARAQTDNPSDADDVVAEAFATVFQLLTEGKGPNEFFRSYLLTVVRRTAHDRNRKARRMPTADDAVLDSAVLDNDPVLSRLESSIMAKAFKSLPERWQAVLWHLDIEGLKPAAAAPLVGLTPNGVSSLALRAREGLRQAYLQQHISQTVGDGCEEYASQLGKYARSALKRTSAERVRAHLDGCAKCTALLMELNDVQGGMRAILFPLVTGIAFSPVAIASLGSAAVTGIGSHDRRDRRGAKRQPGVEVDGGHRGGSTGPGGSPWMVASARLPPPSLLRLETPARMFRRSTQRRLPLQRPRHPQRPRRSQRLVSRLPGQHRIVRRCPPRRRLWPLRRNPPPSGFHRSKENAVPSWWIPGRYRRRRRQRLPVPRHL